jgi:hypothetical protein
MNGGQGRRDRRGFEPPPWEREAFERFQRQREELDKEAALNAALSELKEEQGPSAEGAPPEQTPPVEPEEAVPPNKEYEIPAAQLAELMAGLREEEPRTTREYHKVANAVTALLMASGIGFVVWAGILLGRAGSNAGGLQIIASLLVMVWGFMLIAFAVLLWRKHNL